MTKLKPIGIIENKEIKILFAMHYENWHNIHQAYIRQDWPAIEAIYESAKHCPHTWSAYKHAMSIFPFPKCALAPNTEPIRQTNAKILNMFNEQISLNLPSAKGINTWPKAQLLGHIWWHWQNKAYKISHAKLAKIADTISYADKRYALAEFFTETLDNYFEA